ncbi:MAG: type III pantothenate kinase [Bacteroidota bacterium]
MQIAIDIGNTRAKFAHFEERKILENYILPHEEVRGRLTELISNHEEIIISSTKDYGNLNLDLALLDKVLVLDSKVNLPVEINYKTPQTLGNDRLANVVGAMNLYPAQNLLVIDTGTCFTYDFVTEKGLYLGGNISPGLHLRIKAMNSYTDKLPLIDLRSEFDFIGGSTDEALNNGVWNGCLGEIEHYCERFLREFENAAIIITGGDTEIFGKALKNSIFANPFLTLIGLNEILLFNRT